MLPLLPATRSRNCGGKNWCGLDDVSNLILPAFLECSSKLILRWMMSKKCFLKIKAGDLRSPEQQAKIPCWAALAQRVNSDPGESPRSIQS